MYPIPTPVKVEDVESGTLPEDDVYCVAEGDQVRRVGLPGRGRRPALTREPVPARRRSPRYRRFRLSRAFAVEHDRGRQ